MTENFPQTPSKPIPIRAPAPLNTALNTPRQQPRVEAIKTDQGSLAVLSPVNQNGSFEFDRVIKSGTALKRTRKTKAWKPIYLVLRPNLLSIYKDKEETKLRHQINLSEVTAVARQKDPKRKMDHVFGLFSPSRNYHLAAPTEKDAQEWVSLIRTEARIDKEEEDMILMSPVAQKTTPFAGLDAIAKRENLGSSSSEAEPRLSISVSPEHMHSARRPSQALNWSGNEYSGSFSDFSDTGGHPAFQGSSLSLPRGNQQPNASQASNIGTTPDDERVVYHGWLYVLKSKRGVRQWKKLWIVLRPKTLGLYKNEEEYSANLVIPFANIINAVDIDPVSKSKKHCMQIISEERNYRFCAPDEDSLAKWLGAFKSLLAKRKEAELQRGSAIAINTISPSPVPTATVPSNPFPTLQSSVPK
ncbi:PH domain-like protein [Delitschia confertaspora ATCC 74209]|uniref:PH domain-like protein n=1 Tax=Delitschia confertaspora ATCC 74209 TaxID=1513339 RepID=A0A9P4JL71_9PLEO|nr:PH domain-like protein [Delitschia confertaspora ATCC 74209]